ncbi:MAG: hypothetical protein AB1941_10860 [Gemmatimonadota bacterium]
MQATRFTTLAAATALLAALSAGPLGAQGKGSGGGNGKGGGNDGGGQKSEQVRGGGSPERGNGRAKATAARPSTGSRASTAKSAGSRASTARSTGARSSTSRTAGARAASGSRTASTLRWDRSYERTGDRVYGWTGERYRLSTRRHRDVPPGWCRGVGNPHNTIANCGWSRDRYDGRDGVYRDDDGIWRDGDTRYGGYSDAHDAFHRHHDAVCRDRADDRPFDPAYQLRVSQECSAEHDRWHDRYDPSADPALIRVRLF